MLTSSSNHKFEKNKDWIFGEGIFKKIYVSNELEYNENKCFKISPKRTYQHGGHFESLESP